MAGKKTQGRKKIKMRKIENEDARRITFSKRRSGLFKKASELSTLCGIHIAIIVYSIGGKTFSCIHIAIIVYSIGGKTFSFGHPTLEFLINKFENAYQPQQDYITKYAYSIRGARLEVLNQEFNHLNDKMEQARKKAHMLKKIFMKYFGCQCFGDYVDNLGSDKLQHVKEKMVSFRARVAQPPAVGQIENIGSPIPHDWLKL